MGDITKNISRHELACKCGCGFDSMDYETIKILQECCDHFAKTLGVEKVTLIINSACRCEIHNKFINGSKRSQHLLARALDFWIKSVHPSEVYNYLTEKYEGKYGIGGYSKFTHLDTRSSEARW